jgi:hypothetical protein
MFFFESDFLGYNLVRAVRYSIVDIVYKLAQQHIADPEIMYGIVTILPILPQGIQYSH